MTPTKHPALSISAHWQYSPRRLPAPLRRSGGGTPGSRSRVLNIHRPRTDRTLSLPPSVILRCVQSHGSDVAQAVHRVRWSPRHMREHYPPPRRARMCQRIVPRSVLCVIKGRRLLPGQVERSRRRGITSGRLGLWIPAYAKNDPRPLADGLVCLLDEGASISEG